MREKRIVITGAAFPSRTVQVLRGHGLQVERLPGDVAPDDIAVALDGAWGYILGGAERMPREIWTNLPDLRIVCFLGTGYQAFLEPPEGRSDTWFTYTPHANVRAVAEFTVAMALDRVRLASARAADVAVGRWSGFSTRSMISSRVGVAGMGHIGRTVAEMVTDAFGAKVIYWNRTARPELQETGYERALSLTDLCHRADVLILTMAYVPGDNDGIIGQTELEALGDGSVVINTAAAPLIQPVALRRALLAGRVTSAALDGYYQEPTPRPEDDPHGLLELHPRLLVTPHCASLTDQAMLAMAEMAAANVLAVLSGGTPRHPIPNHSPDQARIATRGSAS